MGTPLVLAHRGASAYAPENTLAAFRLARELGADGIEFDVQMSNDMVPVIIHDDTLERTTDGKGRVADLTIAEITALDAGGWKTQHYRGERIPTLAQVFEALGDWIQPFGAGRPCLVNLELKTEQVFNYGLERQVINLISRYGVQEQILLSSFSALALFRAKKLNPSIPRGLLYEPDPLIALRGSWFRWWAGAHALHPEHVLVDKAYMAWARRKRLPVNTWTVDDPTEARRLAQLGVNAIITNKPDVIREAVH
jgi:glycerophosphoryl diester phosphodiesterase